MHIKSYPSFVARSGQINTPPGSYHTIKEWIRHSFMNGTSRVLEIGCTTGFISIEICRYVAPIMYGLDFNRESLAAAKGNIDPYISGRCHFVEGNASSLPFKESTFTHVIIGGHLPFIPEDQRVNHIQESIRVLRPWGFLLTVLYFYHHQPPLDLVNALNYELNTYLKPEYDKKYWCSLFEVPELDVEYQAICEFDLPDQKRIEAYLEVFNIDDRPNWNRKVALFAENGRYLRYIVAVYRKFPLKKGTLRQFPRGGIYTNIRKISEKEF